MGNQSNLGMWHGGWVDHTIKPDHHKKTKQPNEISVSQRRLVDDRQAKIELENSLKEVWDED